MELPLIFAGEVPKLQRQAGKPALHIKALGGDLVVVLSLVVVLGGQAFL